MTLPRRPRPDWRDSKEAIGSPEMDRVNMLELASTLEEWPVRNQVIRHALDQAARELVRLASAEIPGDAP